jgi:hypothetical protein
MSRRSPSQERDTEPTSAYASASVSAPPPAPWPFEATYSRALPPAFQFDPQAGFTALSDHMRATAQDQTKDQRPRVNGLVATYPTGKIKDSWTGMPSLSQQEKDEYKRGATVSGTIKGWSAGGSIGVVTSCMSSASAQSQGENNWHTVAMARKGDKVWVHDPAYIATAHAGNVKRVDTVPGSRIVHSLVQNWSPVQGVYFQGPPSSYTAIPGQMECMGRSAQWVDATINGTLPWPPDSNDSGGQWAFHYRN